jgi:hypothetical protein
MQTTILGIDEAQVLALFKQAFEEMLREKPDEVREMLREIVEDIIDDAARADRGLALAMLDAEQAPDAGKKVSREEIDCILRGEHLDQSESGEPFAQAPEDDAQAQAA